MSNIHSSIERRIIIWLFISRSKSNKRHLLKPYGANVYSDNFWTYISHLIFILASKEAEKHRYSFKEIKATPDIIIASHQAKLNTYLFTEITRNVQQLFYHDLEQNNIFIYFQR